MKAWIAALLLVAVTAPASAALFINETDADQTGTDTEEFVELYNSGPGAVNFDTTPHVLVFFNGSENGGDASYAAYNLTGTLATGDYYVVGSSTVANLDLDFCPSQGAGCDNQLQNGADAVGLYTGTAASFPGGTLATTTNLIDAIVYGTSDPTDAALLALLGETVQFDENAFGTKDTTSISRTPDGGVFTPGQTPTPGMGNGLAAPVVLPKMTTMAVGASNVAVELCAVDGVGATTFNVESLPANGSLSDNSGAIAAPRAVNGTLRYTPTPGYSGFDTFDVSATDTQPATGDAVTYEMAVQQGGVVISEIMHSPSGDDRAFEWIEIYNLTASPIALTRLDTSRRTTTDTTDNLSVSIPGNTVRIIAADVTTLGLSNDDILCEWNLFETDIIRIPYPQFETMFAAPDVNCQTSDGSRVLLFGAGDVLLDAVDLGQVGSSSGNCGGTSYVFDTLFPADIDAILNDEVLDWFCSSDTGIPGNLPDRPGTSGDVASPKWVPIVNEINYPNDYADGCFGACCLTDGTCLEDSTEAACIEATCQFGSDTQGRYKGGELCAGASCPAAEPLGKCCLPIGVCEDLDECSCLQLGGDFNDAALCNFPGQSTGECPVTVALLFNELDYDTPGTDADEFIELKGTPGGSLAGWTIELHNGNANTNGDTLYRTIDLATAPGGVVPGDGYFVIGSPTVPNVDLLFASATNQLQNGGCGSNGCGDGIVLAFGGLVVEGASYDTTTAGFTARGGTADGVFLPDLGPSDTSIGSLQRLPDGGVWSTTNNTTPGVANFDAGDVGACCFGEMCEPLQFEADCTSNGGEYLGDGTSCDNNPCIPRGSCCLPDGSCRDSLTASECGILGGLWNGEDTTCPDWTAFEACLAGPGGELGAGCDVWNLDGDAPADVDLIDAALFQLSLCEPAPIGACCQLDGNCVELSQFACDLGGGDYRGDGVACAGLDPACDPASPGDILINEVWADDPGDDDHEFVELFGTPAATLNGRSLIVVDGDTEGDPLATAFRSVTLQIDFGAADVLDGGGFFTLGTGLNLVGLVDDSLDARGNNDGLVNEFQNGSQTYALVPTADIVYCTSAGIPDATCSDVTTQLTDASYNAITASAFDAVATIDSDFDDFYFFAPVVRDGGFTFDYAQRIPNGTDTNATSDWETVFGNELGDAADPSSPGATNASQDTIPGACCDGTTCNQKSQNDCTGPGEEFLGAGTACTPNPCECATIAEARLLGDNVAVTLCDVVISSTTDLINFAGLSNFHVQDATGGITVFGDPAADIDPILALVSEGHQIDINGTTDIFNGLFELGAPLNLISDDGFVGVPTPTPVATSDFVDDSPTAEALESTLVELACVEFEMAGGTFGETAANYTVTPVGGGVSATVRVSTDALDLAGSTIPTGPVRVIGIFSQFDDPNIGDAMVEEGYQLLARSTGDLIQPCP